MKDTNFTPATVLLPYKIGFFLVVASDGVISSYVSLYLKQVGLNPSQIGTVLLFRPLGGFLGGLLVPHCAKRFSGEDNAAVSFSLLFVLSTSAIGLCSYSPFATNCPGHEYNSTSEFRDRAWMYPDNNLWLRIVLYGALLFLSAFFQVGMDTLLHGVTMRLLGKDNSKSYGNIRAWGALGYATAALTTGLAIHTTVIPEKICSRLFRLADYHFVFYIFASFSFANLVNMSRIFQNASGEYEDGGSIMSHADFRKAICTLKTSCWLMVLLCRSVFYAVTQGFLNWHLENIGASPALIGSANCTTTTTEFIMFFATPKLIEIFGHTKLVAAGILSYACRFVIFSVVTNPVYILPVEVLEGVMYACIWSSVVSHMSNQVPEEGQTQVQGLIQALCMLGIGLGFPVSGVLTQLLGAPIMFLVFAVLALVTFVAFVLAQNRG